MPVYDDWESALEVCRRIDRVCSVQGISVDIFLVDDGSTAKLNGQTPIFNAIRELFVLVLRRNIGHQRAIAIGLAYLQHHRSGDAVIVMDADGEDKPEDIPKLLKAANGAEYPTAILAERGKRFETITFRFFYQWYRIAHRLVTGRDIRFGNFSVLPWPFLDSLVVFPELWNHYAATMLRSRLRLQALQLDRGKRFSGDSRMNFVGLVIHGLSAIFADQEVVGTRLLMMTAATIACVLVLMMIVLAVKLLTRLAIAGWATTTIGLLLVLASQALITSALLVFFVATNRSQLGFLPIRDYSYFLLRTIRLYPN
jgi:hypothetical protein